MKQNADQKWQQNSPAKIILDTHSSHNKRIREGDFKSKRLGAILKALFLYVETPHIGLCYSKNSSGKGDVYQLNIIKERTQEHIKYPLVYISDYKGRDVKKPAINI